MIRRIFATLVFLAMSLSTAAGDLPDFPFVVAEGEAEIKVAPDMATLHIDLFAFDEDSDEALDDVNKAFNKVLGSLTKFAVESDQIEAGDLKKAVKRRLDDNSNRLSILGYKVARHITVTLNSLENYSQIMESVVATDHVVNVGARFDTASRELLNNQLLTTAAEKAREKAEIMAEGLGMKVDSVYAISQATDFDNFFAAFGASIFEQKDRSESPIELDAAMFVPESITIGQRINVVFRIR